MNILMICKYPLLDDYSVKGKLRGQMKALAAMGHAVSFIGYDREAMWLIRGQERVKLRSIAFAKSPHYVHTLAFLDLFAAARKALRLQRFDLAYMRMCPLSGSGAQLCREAAKHGCRLVVEIPTFPVDMDRHPSPLRRLAMKASDFWWRRSARHVRLFTLIGEPAARYLGVPALNIDNGVDADALPLRRPAPAPDGKVHLLAVAAMSDWHGYDRLIRGIAALTPQERSGVVLDLVGDGGNGALCAWRALADALGVGNQVAFHGYRSGAALDRLFDAADAGVCALGLHRIGLSRASTLKLREYAARGLPFVYAADDPAVPEGFPFALRVASDEEAADARAILAFARRMREQPDAGAHLRAHAQAHMTWQAQFDAVFAALAAQEDA